jgi:hypothetical protein
MSKPGCVLLLILLTGLTACDNEISSASRLRRPRLLAVQAEPPNPAFGQSTRLRPLVYLPPGESVSYEWSWCPVPTTPDDGYQCPVEQAAVDNVAALAGLAEIPPLFLGTTETIEFTNPFPPALLASLCAGDSTATSWFLGSAGVGKSQQVYSCAIATLPVQMYQRPGRPLRLLRPRPGPLAGTDRAARLLPLPHQRGDAQRRAGPGQLLHRAR